ncbi:hypothetical protein HMT_4 [Clostridium phage HM T]|uniref:Uncharacterized protein n=1 Tax=Clostridium saccharoperbutylacetonicum N1-4(HMT) TaxID=931276 RepID=M1MEI6_9CLOT|nr:hypothetical protein [Clostridium saccharoperbutylacetonicum]AMB17416.1 hypothetical protein HMT_4 [Clostridium phage HM T]AGF54768.1 hypothetical protein Cspa_c09920 [Clostridium saccharoperbutylacetonicum N1-4(HMT)]NRT58711.1 hypothetical protein [Clostridium saccharoperbutylacetonicum]NSB27900.1 hypothetical protein [Clostridium saccharoperbutylacetonicum]NSB41383.1 hypothetical protein [Clostridium saccharoperbutylacetonicum]
MIEKIIENKKYRDFYDYKSSECKISFAIVIIIVLMLSILKLDLFENFNNYKPGFQNITIYVASGLLAMIGIILAGVAFILGLLDDEFKNSIKNVVTGDPIKEIMLSFEFLTINLGFGSVIFFTEHFFLYSNIYINKYTFYIILLFNIYYFSFLVFYTISLIYNSIELYHIKDIYKEVSRNEKSIYDKANEIRIDYILSKILEDKKQEDFLKILFKMVDEMELEDKDKIKKYFEDYYGA